VYSLGKGEKSVERSSIGMVIGGLMGFLLVSGLGEIVWGNLEVTGNITAENVFIPTHSFGSTNITQTVAQVDTWYNINWSYTHIEGNWSGNSTSMVVNDAGHYQVCYGGSLKDSTISPNSQNAMRVTKNGAELEHTYIELDLFKQNADEWLSNCYEGDFITGDAVSIQYISSDVDVTIESDCTYSDVPCDYAFASMERMG